MSPPTNLKIVLLGEGRVGKTSLVLRYVNNVFSEKQQSTIQASYLSKRLVINDKPANLAIWDTAGQERFHALGPIYYRDADGALLVFDITDMDSFVRVKNWVKELKKIVGNDISLVIAANKVDLDRNRTVPQEAADEYAKSVGATLFNTSAKKNIGIDDAFFHLTKTILDRQTKTAANGTGPAKRNKGSTLLLVEDDEKKESSCC
eukprot:TRINITY_DN4869_c0_g1::TRINITY_DN4869_c0_g1_i1::g.873::m.873 TRINITY_DN4869_c0_g1::TRINITY_DN4869_c0_g1_i1::g.873  ORF type:complete len:205 (+),score=31.38,sp/Q17R06/RAB21_BOVIN/54.41/8e-72,Ras/PF00071.17/2.2e-53,Miro/PF08477.8/4.3e-19,Arf/PF00025.16/1.1e-11,GTP_EFTU/PF00009.22/1.5e-06,Gtr1_RagA/PF04670.7/2.1e-05,MMR_HSR1/PF01926.18/7.3e-05,SRPRB/PF09439.5/0.0087,PduV-EutP/PF10662.4/0.17,AAA_14/PF13173.1/0.11,Arch_ATPase/PF01637.13/0.12,DNA_pol3_delta2/PF13177.1/0.19,DNA_pol3_delta2/PF13177.1/1.